MADCSASGTAIDRAAAAIVGGNTASSGPIPGMAKHVSSLFGHAVATTTTTSSAAAVNGVENRNGLLPMAVTAPQHMVIPSSAVQNQSSTNHVHQPQQQEVSISAPAQFHNQLPSAPVMMNPHFDPHLHHHHQHHHHRHQNQMMMMQQQQQAMSIMMMQQQQQIMMQQQQRLQQQQNQTSNRKAERQGSEKTESLQPEKMNDETLMGHDGQVEPVNIEELATASADAQSDSYDDYEYGGGRSSIDQQDDLDPHIANGASIEQLAAAWAEAEAEYEAEFARHEQQQPPQDEHETFNSVLHGSLQQNDDGITNDRYASNDHAHVAPYEFIHRIQEEINTDTNKEQLKDFMEEGMEAFREGRLRDAIRSFEMELQVHNPNNATAWKMLGKAHAQSDQDQRAISCLESSINIDPFCADALLALAVSHLNELNHERALSCMKEFLTHNPKYAGMDDMFTSNGDSLTADEGASNGTTTKAFDEVKQMLMAAAEHDPTDAADIHEALGVLYNVSKEYELAAESFRKALQTRGDDECLWNKLGATLANGSDSEHALAAYHEALKIKPKYARAWLNMGISYSNMQDFDEAARCYLQTLSLNPDATHCWTYLRLALSSTEKWDLLPLVFSQDLVSFQDHYDFVLY